MFQKLVAHPAYDSFWQDQVLDRILAKEPLKVPTLHVHSLWDQEDIYGAPAAYAATETKDTGNDRNYMIIGPWRHGQSNALDGSKLGAIDFNGNSSAWYRSKVLIPFFDRHLKDGSATTSIAPVTAFETGANVWHSYDRWPRSCASGCPSQSRPIYLLADGALGWRAPQTRGGFAEYVSDPARPVTYRQRPILSTYNPQSSWGQWLVDDQRFAETRPDVVTFVSEVLSGDVRLAGEPIAKFFASTTGTDSDWVVKLIDVYPAEHPEAPEMGGYELPISMDILRGRYREDPSKPTPIPANKVIGYEIKLPHVSHKFRKGHRIMVQIQSSWFPLYDRNPQTYVPNIFTAKKSDYKKATQRIHASAQYPSRIELPLIP
jgi:putative CocE/NonD family hydrolase